MDTVGSLILCLVILIGLFGHGEAGSVSRSAFPADFIFGAGSAAYQYEGAAHIDGKGPSIWDTFTQQHPEKISGNTSGVIAQDFYHRFKGDVALMKELGLDAFRFSISWSRILPLGKVKAGVNKKGVEFYNNLINELLANGIKPYVTIFHWDLPQALEDEYGGFRSANIVDDFREYADLLFKEFGDRVKHWFTLNEPYSFSNFGYCTGTFAPGRCSNYIGTCSAGDSATEPYIVSHHLLLSHGTTVKLYKEKYQANQRGLIGVTLVTDWILPISANATDMRAAFRAQDFILGWFLHPITYGDYPETMKAILGSRLPKFTAEQSKLLKGSKDFLGMNYYTTVYAENNAVTNRVNKSYSTDNHASLTTAKNGVSIGPATDLNWLFVYPKGIHDLMVYIKEKYDNPDIYITENGIASATNNSLPLKQVLNDTFRINYHREHLEYLSRAIKYGVKVKGYFPWTFLDDFEWDGGFAYRFGFIYIDYLNGLKRIPKASAYWYKKFIQK